MQYKVLSTLVITFLVASSGNASVDVRFHYNLTTGLCLDEKSNAGLNTITLEELVKTRNGECGDFRNMVFDNESFVNVDDTLATFEGINFAGADFMGARALPYNHMTDGNFRGANLKNFAQMYMELGGVFDQFTSFPAASDCRSDISNSIFNCSR